MLPSVIWRDNKRWGFTFKATGNVSNRSALPIIRFVTQYMLFWSSAIKTRFVLLQKDCDEDSYFSGLYPFVLRCQREYMPVVVALFAFLLHLYDCCSAAWSLRLLDCLISGHRKHTAQLLARFGAEPSAASACPGEERVVLRGVDHAHVIEEPCLHIWGGKIKGG